MFRVASGIAVGIIFFIPFLPDRLVAPKVSPFIATLVFPCSWTALEYVKSLGNGSWGALAYTQYGNLPFMQLASVICADQDYPSLIRQAGANNADILLVPAQDWAAVDPLHSKMGVFRAIENGFSIVKGTGGGLSIAVDPYGRKINSSDASEPAETRPAQTRMISCIPTKGVVTIYSRVGDAFAWLCIVGCFIVIGWAAYVSSRKR